MRSKIAGYGKEKSIKAIARARVGAPKPVQVLEEKPARKPKHKKPTYLLQEETE
jgi:hypothetical protein